MKIITERRTRDDSKMRFKKPIFFRQDFVSICVTRNIDARARCTFPCLPTASTGGLKVKHDRWTNNEWLEASPLYGVHTLQPTLKHSLCLQPTQPFPSGPQLAAAEEACVGGRRGCGYVWVLRVPPRVHCIYLRPLVV
jgi:hypothetical protein